MAEAATQAMLLKPVVYCDQQKQPIVLSALPAPDSVKTFAQHLEHATGQKPQLLSYWNYSHKRYDALQSIDQLRQDEALLVRGSHNEVSNTGTNVISTTTTMTTMPMYRAQLWLETTWLRTTPVDPDKDSEEFAELERHVRRCGRRGPSGQLRYKLTKAVRVHYTYLARQFDETRQTKLHGYQNRIKLLYYTANAWSVGQVLEHGFVMQDELPSAASPLVANHSAEVNAVLAMSHVNTAVTSIPSDAHETNTLRHPFLFTSHPLPRNNDNNAVVVDVGSPDREQRNVLLLLLLLCEVAPGRQWRSEQPLQSITSDSDTRDVVESQEQPPAGYDSVVYEENSPGTDTGRHGSPHRRHRSGSTASSQAVPRLPPSVLQVQTSMSHQALPRYLLTLEVDTTPVRSHSNTVRVAGNKGEETHVDGATTSKGIVVADDRIELAQSTPLRRHASRPRSVHSTHVRRSRSLTNAPNNDTNANHHVNDEGQRRAASATRRVRSARAVGHEEQQQQLLVPRQHVQVVQPSTTGQPTAHIAQQQQHTMVPATAIHSSNIVMPVQKPPLMPVMTQNAVVPASVRPIPPQQPQMMLEISAASMRERLLAPAVLQCALHPRRMTTLYCSTCNELICPYCASVGTHQGHAIRAADEQAAQMQGIVQEVCRELREGRDQVERVARQLTLERADAVQRQGRRVQSLRLLLNEVRRAIDERESILTRQLATQEAGLQAPVDSIDHVRTSYAEVLQPLETALKDYFVALQRVATGPPCGAGTSMTLKSSVGQSATYNAVSATSITQNEAAVGGDITFTNTAAAHQARVALLLFLRNAPHLLEQARIFLRLRAQDNVEGGLRDAIASVRAANRRAEQMLEHVKVSELRRQIESLGDAPALAAQKPRSALLASSTMNASSEALNDAENVPRLLRRNSMKSLTSNVVSPSALMATTTISPSQRAALEEMRTMSGLERCLVDLQRGFIWTIQDATKLFAPGQTRTVCSTPFQLLRTSWELRIAALPKSDLASDFSSHFNGKNDDKATPMKSTNGTGHLSELSGTNGEAESTNTRSPARATEGQPFAAGRGVSLSAIQTSLPATNTNITASDEEQWLGLFLCPKEHGMRMDFRVIAFSEVVWREWNVTGWSDAFVGKGWGLYPFLRRKDLMRTDKLARDNTVKLCITPISELY